MKDRNNVIGEPDARNSGQEKRRAVKHLIARSDRESHIFAAKRGRSTVFDRRTEHYYIPLVLFLLNCAVIHFLFVTASGDAYPGWYKAGTSAATLLLVFAAAGKRRWLMLPVSFFYLFWLVYPFFLL